MHLSHALQYCVDTLGIDSNNLDHCFTCMAYLCLCAFSYEQCERLCPTKLSLAQLKETTYFCAGTHSIIKCL